MFYDITDPKSYPLEQSNPHHELLPYMPDHSYAILFVLCIFFIDLIMNGFDITQHLT